MMNGESQDLYQWNWWKEALFHSMVPATMVLCFPCLTLDLIFIGIPLTRWVKLFLQNKVSLKLLFANNPPVNSILWEPSIPFFPLSVPKHRKPSIQFFGGDLIPFFPFQCLLYSLGDFNPNFLGRPFNPNFFQCLLSYHNRIHGDTWWYIFF